MKTQETISYYVKEPVCVDTVKNMNELQALIDESI